MLDNMKKLFFIAALACSSLFFNACDCCCCKSDSLKVVSFNVRLMKGDDGSNSWEFRKEASPAMINTVQPDVFGVQEAFKEQEQYLLDNCTNYKSVGVGRDDGVDKGERMSIFWNTEKVEMLDWGTFWLSETPNEPSKGWDAACRRTATWGFFSMKNSGKKFFYVNTHLDHKGSLAKANGLKLVRSEIAKRNPDNLPMILTGDFNILESDSLIVAFSKDMKNAKYNAEKCDEATTTYNGWGHSDNVVIDYIFYDGFSACKSYRVINEQYAGKPYISDHYPIVAELEF